MNRTENIEDVIKRSLPSATAQQADAALARVHSRLESEAADAVVPPVDLATPRTRWTQLAAAAVIVIAATVGASILWRSTEASLYRVVEGDVHRGSTIRSNGDGKGAVLALTDGSRVEMRSQSELALERADDGVRILLSRGGLIVNAAKQRTGHLHVQTKDMTVSVVGTVFVVNADAEGSRVAVIEGEVRVQQGTSEKKLLPGEQMATSPAMEAALVVDAIAWSRNAGALLSLLRQSTLVPPPMPAQRPTDPREKFEVASIRLRGDSAGGGVRSGGPGDAAAGGGRAPACGGGMDLDPRRVNIRGYTLYRLIVLAYGGDCFRWELMSNPEPLEGGPGWIRSDQWDIQALIPEGSLAYTPQYVDIGGGRTAQQHIPGPRLQIMFQALLADRFGLVLRRETRRGPLFALTVAQSGPRLTPWKDGDPVTEREMIDLLARNHTLLSEQELSLLGVTAAEFAERWAKRTIEFQGPGLMGVKASMANLVAQLEAATLWPVVDRTGITGEFNYRLPRYRNPSSGPLQPRRMGGGSAPGTDAFDALAASLEKELGLKLEASQGPREVLVIDQVRRPTEN